ncbi:AI-2E family transporter [Tellurirhabdus bombi]|uniref:AI-2E family transporter n=1 Tax=Tellurirhabdus bombi TaxID=2907205 RepID=UPI001F1F243A|nr:AI-2E family transporter [Tellurirhabdus bombi]
MANIYTPRQQRILLITSLIVIAGFILLGLRQYISAFLGAGILYVVFRPWFNNLVHKRKLNRRLITVLLMLFSLIVIILPFLSLSLLLVDRIQFYSKNSEQILQLIDKLEKATGLQLTSQDNIKSVVSQGASFASKQFPMVLSGTLDLVIILGLLYVALYFMFMEEEAFLRGFRKYLPFRRETIDELGEDLKNMVNANVLGQALVSLVQAVLTGLTLWIFGVPDAAFWGTVAFFMAFIPVLGTPLVWGPAGLIMISQGSTGSGVGILVVGVVVIVNIDNLLRIALAKRMGDVHPFVTLTGIVLGVPIFGILGLVIGPLLMAYFMVLMKVFEKQNRQYCEALTEREQKEGKLQQEAAKS